MIKVQSQKFYLTVFMDNPMERVFAGLSISEEEKHVTLFFCSKSRARTFFDEELAVNDFELFKKIYYAFKDGFSHYEGLEILIHVDFSLMRTYPLNFERLRPILYREISYVEYDDYLF